jgi:hypothetical protein
VDAPLVVIKNEGQLYEAKASSVVGLWNSEHFAPISGEKPVQFVVFAKKNMTGVLLVRLFFARLRHTYSEMGFGRMDPWKFNSDESECEILFINSSKEIEVFCVNHRAGFHLKSLVLFAFGVAEFSNEWSRKAIVLSTSVVDCATAPCLRALSWSVYCRMRFFSTHISGDVCNLGGFPYDPPFHLVRLGNPAVHVIWDVENGTASWTNDVGSILEFDEISEFGALETKINKFIDESGGAEITLSVYGEGIKAELLEEIKTLPEAVRIYSIVATPAIQCRWSDPFCGDLVLFGEEEQMIGGGYCSGVCSCLVVARNCGGYKVVMYRGEEEKEGLLRFVEGMCRLSWMTVAPGAEQRAEVLPLHVCGLLRERRKSVFSLDGFEFVAPQD